MLPARKGKRQTKVRYRYFSAAIGSNRMQITFAYIAQTRDAITTSHTPVSLTMPNHRLTWYTEQTRECICRPVPDSPPWTSALYSSYNQHWAWYASNLSLASFAELKKIVVCCGKRKWFLRQFHQNYLLFHLGAEEYVKSYIVINWQTQTHIYFLPFSSSQNLNQFVCW